MSILICGKKNDRSFRYRLGRSTSPMAVAAYTHDKLPPAEQQALPNEGHIVAALEWAERAANAEAGSGMSEARSAKVWSAFSQEGLHTLRVITCVEG
jgi:hypothetical protein